MSGALRRPARLDAPWVLALLLGLLGAGRLALIDRGAQSLPDETFYYHSLLAAEHLSAGDVRLAFAELNRNGGCPAAALTRLVPAAGQLAYRAATGRAHADPASLRIAQVWHVLLSLGVTAALYLLARRLLGSARLALVAAVVHALLANTNLYLRHLLPYDQALLLHLLALLVVVRAPETGRGLPLRATVLAGLLTGLGYASYPGSYAFPPLVALLTATRGGGGWRHRLMATAAVALAGVGTLLGFELLSALGGGSYVATSRALSGTINQGSFDEGFTFLAEYLVAVEGPLGVALLAGTLACLALGARAAAGRGPAPGSRELAVLVAGAAGAWLLHALGGVALRRVVFYGRLIHLLLPVLVLAAVAAAAALPRPRLRRAALVLLLALAVVGGARFLWRYAALAYPRDVLYALGVRSDALPPRQRPVESTPMVAFHSPPGTRAARPHQGLVVVNAAFFYPLEAGDHAPHTAPEGAEVLYRGLHFQSFPAYGYEGLTPEERALARERRYQVLVYARRRP